MKVLFLDCFSGISGDMTVAALADLGVKPSAFEWELSKLAIGDFHLHFEPQQRQTITGVKFTVHSGATHTHDQEAPGDHGHSHAHTHGDEHEHEEGHDHEAHAHSHDCCGGHEHGHAHPHAPAHLHGGEHEDEQAHEHHHHHEHPVGRSHREIRELIEASELSPFVKTHALGIFQRIAVAEGKIHGQPPADVTFHEVGALDSIADIVCACVGLEALGVEQVFVSSLQDGHGTIQCAHGTFPVPAPATLGILHGIPLGQIDEPHELITPTGAAIVAEFAVRFGPMPTLKIEKIGYGLGTRQLVSRPNALRAVLGELVTE